MLNQSADPISIAVERVVEATHEVRDLIEELNEVLGAAYELINATAFRSSNCLSLMYASS